MGGYGSGVPYMKNQRPVKEDGLTLNLETLFKKGILPIENNIEIYNGSLQWTNTTTGRKTASIGFDFRSVDVDEKRMVLKYTNTYRGQKTEVKLDIRLECTYPLYGGRRWWFTCPIIKNGYSCGRRTNRLYSVSGCPYFGCRNCFNLTYESSNDSHKFDGLIARMAFDTGKTVKQVKEDLKDTDWRPYHVGKYL